jgi:prepilin peptidase CpaA
LCGSGIAGRKLILRLNSSYAEMGGILEAAAGTVLLLTAACRDLVTRTIPDTVSILLVACGLASRALTGSSGLIASVVASITLFCLLLLAHGRGMLGGGDVKLMAAVACGLSLPELYRFILVTGLSGGVLAGIHLSFRRILKGFAPMKPPSPGTNALYRLLAAERWRIARRGPLPYGVAIACGGIAALGTRFSW